MTRENSQNIKPYLAENLHKYKNLNETIGYMIATQIPSAQRRQMYQSFDSKFPEVEHEEIKDLYVVTHDYLKMGYINLCKLFYYNQQRE